MVKNCLTYFCGKTYAGFCCKKLGCDADCQSCGCHQYQDKEFLYDVAVIVMGNTHINDLGNDDRHQQVKHNFQKFEKRSQNAFFFVVSKIFCECSHFFFFPPFPFYYNKPLLLYSLRDDTYNIVFDVL